MCLAVKLLVDGVVGAVFGNDFLHLLDGGEVIELAGEGDERIDVL